MNRVMIRVIIFNKLRWDLKIVLSFKDAVVSIVPDPNTRLNYELVVREK